MTQADRVHSTPRRTASKIKPKKSAISLVEMSGLDLVPTRKRHGKPATMRDYATIDFSPWTREPGMKKNELLPSDETVNRLAVSCRIAYATMLKSREDLIAMHGKANHELVDELMADLADTAERLKELAEMVEGAYARVLASAAAAHTQGIKFKGVNDKPARRKSVQS